MSAPLRGAGPRGPEPPDIEARWRAALAGHGEEVAASEPLTISLPPHFFPPPYGAQPIYPFAKQTALAGPNANWSVPAGIVYQTDRAQVAIIRLLGLAVLNMLSSTVVTTYLRINGNPQAPVRQMPSQPVAYAERSWDTVAYVTPPGAKIDQMITVVDGGTYDVTGYYSGWVMSVTDFARLWGGGAGA